MRRFLLALIAVSLAGVRAGAQPADAGWWADELVRTSESGAGWREVFALGQDVADLEPTIGLEVMRRAWPHLEQVQVRQQLVKAWQFDLPAPYAMRLHPKLFEFFLLVLRAGDEEVSSWVLGFLPSYAWQEFDRVEDAIAWLEEAAAETPEQAIVLSQRAWSAAWLKADAERTGSLTEVVRLIGHPYRRNAPLVEEAERDGTAARFVKIVDDGRVSAEARLAAFSQLTSVRPHEYTLEGFREMTEELGKQLRADLEAQRAKGARELKQDIRVVNGHEDQRWILHPPVASEPPELGYGILVVLPGGDGSAEFAPFVRDTIRSAAGEDFAVAQMIAPAIAPDSNAIVWPLERLRDERVEFTIEPVVEQVVLDVQAELFVNPERVYVMGWSSGGPPTYALALRKDSPFRGAFVVMSVFKPGTLPALDEAAGMSFYILHSPQDFIAMRFPEQARDDLGGAGARVRLENYEGGHGWQGGSINHIGRAIRWFDEMSSNGP